MSEDFYTMSVLEHILCNNNHLTVQEAMKNPCEMKI